MPIDWSSMVGWPKSTWHNWSSSIVAFVRRKLANFCESQELQSVQTHKIKARNQAVYIRATTHPFHRADQRSRLSIGTSLWVVFNAGVEMSITLLAAAFISCYSFELCSTIKYTLLYVRRVGILRRNSYTLSRFESFYFCNPDLPGILLIGGGKFL